MRKDALSNEAQMADAVARFLRQHRGCRKTQREVRVARARFDVVGYNKNHNTVVIAECKRGSKPRTIGNCFGQLIAYLGLIAKDGKPIIHALNDLIGAEGALRMGKEGKLRLQFFVALTDRAFGEKNLALLRFLKQLAPQIGLIRVNRHGRCRMRHKGRKQEPRLFNPKTIEVPVRGI